VSIANRSIAGTRMVIGGLRRARHDCAADQPRSRGRRFVCGCLRMCGTA